jgi:hypothetical protein
MMEARGALVTKGRKSQASVENLDKRLKRRRLATFFCCARTFVAVFIGKECFKKLVNGKQEEESQQKNFQMVNTRGLNKQTICLFSLY